MGTQPVSSTQTNTSNIASADSTDLQSKTQRTARINHPLRSIIWRAARLDVVTGVLISPVHALCEVALGFVTGALLQLIFSSASENNFQRILPKALADLLPNLISASREQWMTLVPAMLVLVGFCRMLTSFGSNYLLERAGHRVAHALRTQFLDSYLQTSGRVLDTRNPDEVTNRILLDTTLLQGLVSKGTIGALRDGLVVVGTALAMLYIASYFFIVLLFVFIPVFLALRWVSRRLEFYTRESARRQVELATRGMQTRNGLAAIYGMGAQSREKHDLQLLSNEYFQFIRKTFLLRVGFRPAMEVFAVAILALALQWRLNTAGEVDVASYSTVFVLAALSFRPLKNVSGFVSQFAELKAVWSRLTDEWDVVHTATHRPQYSLQSEVLRPGVALRVFDLAYDSLDGRRILYPTSIDFKEGQRIALVGESGAGKSTLLRLLAGLLPPNQGQVVGASKSLLATQSPYVFQGSIFENIVYPQLPEQSSELRRARERALELVLTLMLAHTAAGAELFLNKKVGFMGEGLSGGEKARVALARLLFADKPILLLDEPTANLDATSAAAFWEAVWRWQRMPGRARTVVAVTHARKELEHFDEAYLFSEGKHVWSGSGKEASVLEMSDPQKLLKHVVPEPLPT
ncbi:MAG: ABC transporter ATP-binding protein [Betaproteobacteria bacterium]|nr:ABC transporter ATP-binding protein [Betaproteobacteria bacterium]